MPKLVWHKRAKVRSTGLSMHHAWSTTCGRYRVVFIRRLVGELEYFLAIKRHLEGGESPLSRHRTKRAAQKACEEDRKREK